MVYADLQGVSDVRPHRSIRWGGQPGDSLVIASTMLSSHDQPRTQVLRVAKDRALYLEGDAAPCWYAVAEGVVRSCRIDSDGQRQITGFHFAGDVFGLDAEQRLDTAEAVTEVSVWCLPHEPGAEVAEAHFGNALRKALANARATMAVLSRRLAHERLAAFILLIGRRMDATDRIDFPMSRADIADHLGLTYHTVSRSLSQLCDEGLVSLEGSLRCKVCDLGGLRILAGETA
jgi:CRP/FNR family transcriptional regulator/CRP/FNR family nitrogen fixation transcriptional regulator